MNRALDLARRGAGLVSPNPMVGAVLVNDGRPVGEGHHLYERLRHAESYALEMAGGQSWGATLYCNLEPCCHLGRTPPCTDTLIAAGIARAVIAVQDPDPRVSGRGIGQLRAAGIQVEVGLCEREALRLNETYFKYAATRVPFLHAVVFSEASEWAPSHGFLEMASAYDAIVLGPSPELNRTVLSPLAGRPRHRALLVAGPAQTISNCDTSGTTDPTGRTISVLSVDPEGQSGKAPAAQPESKTGGHALLPGATQFTSLIESLAGAGATSVLLVDAGVHLLAPGGRLADKITLVSRRTPAAASTFGADLVRKLDDVVSCEAGELIEITGYPRCE